MIKVANLLLALAVMMSAAASPSVTDARSILVVGGDISTSGAFTDPDSPELPNEAAQMVYQAARQLERGDMIVVRTIGEYGRAATEEIVINVTRENPPERAARIAAALIAQIPKKIADGSWQQAHSTNIIWFLRDSARQYDCVRNSVTILAYTDGLEHSEYSTESRMLDGMALPVFDTPIFLGCSIGMHSIGERANQPSVSDADQLVATWEVFLNAHKAASALVTSYIPK